MWCRTYLKNPEFSRLSRSGATDAVNNFYIEIIKRYRPRVLNISGGEAILFPGIRKFLIRAQKYVSRINLYTSYQYSTKILSNINLSGVDPNIICLTHSVIHFLPDQWHYLTRGFPYQIYTENLVQAKKLPFKKHIKFVINHDDCEAEVQRFQEIIEPDELFRITYKLLNDQNNGFGAPIMKGTLGQVKQRLQMKRMELVKPDPAIASAVAQGKLLELCRYRQEPLEVRFAFYRKTADAVVLKIRFCAYFGPKFSHKFKVGVDPLKKIDKWYNEGLYKEHCYSCRLKHYFKSGTDHRFSRDGRPS